MYYNVDTDLNYDSEFSTQDYFSDDISLAGENYLTYSSDDLGNNFAQEILNAVNAERAAAGLTLLKLTGTLMDGAATRAGEIVSYFSHTRPDGTSFSTVVEDTYPSYYVGENIAAGFQTTDGVMNGWMNSEGHRENILHSCYTELGVGLAYDANSEYGYHWVQIFGNPYISPKNLEDGYTFTLGDNYQVNMKVGSNFNDELWADSLNDIYAVSEINAVGNPNHNILAGNSMSNIIYDGSGNSSLWGGSDNIDDTLVGGSGSEWFWYGKYEGYDVVSNVDSSDVVNLYDANLDEITSTEIFGGQVVVRFNTGNALVVNDTDSITPIFQLSDGSRYNYNRDSGQWQNV